MYVSASDFPVLDEPTWSSAATLLFPIGPKIQTSGGGVPLEAPSADKIHGMRKEIYEVKIYTIIYTHIVIKLFS